MGKIKNILFDWSGTLQDDFTSVYKTAMIVFEKLGGKRISENEFRREFVLPYMNFWNKYFPEHTKTENDRLFAEALRQVEKPKPYKGVRKVLEKLNSLDINMIIISTHNHVLITSEAKKYGFLDLFQEINGSVYNKIEVITKILERNNFTPAETIFVADMTHDINAGKVAGVKTVALTWGYQLKEKLIEANPDHIIDRIPELMSLL